MDTEESSGRPAFSPAGTGLRIPMNFLFSRLSYTVRLKALPAIFGR